MMPSMQCLSLPFQTGLSLVAFYLQGYSQLVHEHQLQFEKHLPGIPHVTLLVVMPATIDLG